MLSVCRNTKIVSHKDATAEDQKQTCDAVSLRKIIVALQKCCDTVSLVKSVVALQKCCGTMSLVKNVAKSQKPPRLKNTTP